MRTDDEARVRARTAVRAAKAGASVAMNDFRGSLDLEYKDGQTDVVTQTDRDAQDRVRAVLQEDFPDETVIGEEGDGPTRIPEHGPAWIVDPIDGTHNFVAGTRLFTTSVAAISDGDPVAGVTVLPALGDVYLVDPDEVTRNGESVSVSEQTDRTRSTACPTMWWDLDRRRDYATVTRGIVTRFGDMRRYGSAQLELAMVAAGELEAVVADGPTNPWDTVAGVAMVRAAGGTVTDASGEPWHPESRGIVASNGHLHTEAVATLAEGSRSD